MSLDGNIGILGNGAGLCMGTLDVVAQAGGRPANFPLMPAADRSAEAIADALEVITSNRGHGILNIFGGITRCDEVARGIIEAYRGIGLTLPWWSARRHQLEGRPGPCWPKPANPNPGKRSHHARRGQAVVEHGQN